MTTALITGASAGIGRAFARELARTGHHLVLVARDETRLAALAAELSAAYDVSCEVLAADLADRAQLERVADRILAGGATNAAGASDDGREPVDLLINNAGFGLRTAFLDSDVADEERQFAVLCHAVLVLSHAAGRAMRARGRGQIINVSSVASFVTMGSYSASKAFVTAFSQALALELRGTGVGVTALCPGYTRTEFHQRMGVSGRGIPGPLWLDADAMVRAGLADARAGKVISTPGAIYKAAAALTGVLPRSAVRGVSGLVEWQRGSRRLTESGGRHGRSPKAPLNRERGPLGLPAPPPPGA